MDNPTEKKEKVIINPRPPKSMNPDLATIKPVCKELPLEQPEEAVPVNPDCKPLNNVVEGPAQGLAGVPAEPEVEAAEKK